MDGCEILLVSIHDVLHAALLHLLRDDVVGRGAKSPHCLDHMHFLYLAMEPLLGVHHSSPRKFKCQLPFPMYTRTSTIAYVSSNNKLVMSCMFACFSGAENTCILEMVLLGVSRFVDAIRFNDVAIRRSRQLYIPGGDCEGVLEELLRFQTRFSWRSCWDACCFHSYLRVHLWIRNQSLQFPEAMR